MRNAITLACTDCKQRNYQTNKNKKNNPDRIEMMKYCNSAVNIHYTVKQNNSYHSLPVDLRM